MVQLIVGEKGKGKTKELLDRVNKEIKEAKGTIVYLDKSRKHMYELNNKVRLIDTSEYDIRNSQEFVGFLSGILSQDNDLEKLWNKFSRTPLGPDGQPLAISDVVELYSVSGSSFFYIDRYGFKPIDFTDQPTQDQTMSMTL